MSRGCWFLCTSSSIILAIRLRKGEKRSRVSAEVHWTRDNLGPQRLSCKRGVANGMRDVLGDFGSARTIVHQIIGPREPCLEKTSAWGRRTLPFGMKPNSHIGVRVETGHDGATPSVIELRISLP